MSLGKFSEFLFGNNLHWQVFSKSESREHSNSQMKLYTDLQKISRKENLSNKNKFDFLELNMLLWNTDS